MPKLQTSAHRRMLKRIRALGDIEALPKAEWDAFLDAMPRDEFLAMIVACYRLEDKELSKQLKKIRAEKESDA